MHIAFTHIGKPQSKGAHTSFIPKRKDGSLVMRGGRPVVVTKDTNPNQESAQHDLMAVALAARQAAGAGVEYGPVAVTIRFYFDRPKSHYGTGRNEGVIKDSAPGYPVTAADLDKLARQVYDALTGTVIRDDKQIVLGGVAKAYAEGDTPPRTEVEVRSLEEPRVKIDAGQLALAA